MEITKAICPECGSKSLNIGISISTLASPEKFSDDDGKIHIHNPNKISTSYTCRKCGTEFVMHEYETCWCGWCIDKPFITYGVGHVMYDRVIEKFGKQ